MRTFVKTALACLATALLAVPSWAAGEIISFNVNNTTANDEVSGLLSESALCVANRHWNVLNCPNQGSGNNISVMGAKDNSGAITPCSVSGSGFGKWQKDAKAAFGEKGYNYADGPWTLTLDNIPYTMYDVVLYMGTDIGSIKWGAIRIGSGETTAYYVPSSEDASTAVCDGVTETTTWGQTCPTTHGYGTDVIRIRNLTKRTLELATLKPTDSTRAGLYGFQIVNTGKADYERTLSGNGNWKIGEGALDWGTSGDSKPAENATVELTVSSDATLTMNAATTVSVLTISGDGKLTFVAGSEGQALNSFVTQVKADVDATSGVASLGAVAIAEGKTLTVDKAGVVSSASGSGTLALNGVAVTDKTCEALLAGGGTLCVTNADVAGENGAMINGYGAQNGQFVIDNSTRQDTESANRVALYGTKASITVKADSKVALKLRDFGGWSSFAGKNVKLLLEEGVVATVEDVGNKGCFAGQLVLENNVTVTGGSSANHALNFWKEGTKENPNIVVKEGCTATYAGELWTEENIFIGVELDATLKVTAKTKNKDYTKEGAGTLDLSEATMEGTTVTLKAGTLILGTNRPGLTLPSVESGATLPSVTLKVTTTLAERMQGKFTLGCDEIPSNVTVFADGVEATVNEDGSVSIPEGEPMTWTPKGDEAWSTGSWGEGQSAPTSGSVTIDVSALSGNVTLSLNATEAVALKDVKIVAGGNSSTVTFALSEGTQTTFEGLVSEVSVSLPVQMCAEGAEVNVGTNELTLTSTTSEGEVTAPKVLVAGSIRIGAGVVYPLDTAVDTLPLTLAGGKVKTSTARTYRGQLTLEADSEVSCGGDLTLNSGKNKRNELVLNAHKLTKRGTGMLRVDGVDLDEGEIHSVTGQLRLSGDDGNDSKLTNVTLTFDQGAGYSASHWHHAEGLLTLNCAGEVDMGAEAGKRCRPPSGKTLSLKKCGPGVAKFPQDGSNYINGTTEVTEGTLVLKMTGNVSMPETLTVAEGATLKLQGTDALTVAQAAVKGNVEVAETASLTLKASGKNALQSLKVAEGASAILVGVDIEVADLLEGAGTLTLGDGTTETHVTVKTARGDWPLSALSTMTVRPKAMLVFDSGSGNKTIQDATNILVEEGGVFELKSGYIYSDVSGDGETKVTGSCFFGYSDKADNWLRTKRVTVEKAGTLGIRTLRELTLTVPTLHVDGVLKKDDWCPCIPTLSVENGKVLSGSGRIEVPLTLAAGATLDASAGALTVTNTLTLPEDGTVTVKVPEAGYGTVLTASGVDAAKFALETLQAQKALVATDAALVLVQTPENVDTTTAEGMAIAQAAAQAGEANVREAKAVSAANPSVERDVAGAGLFTNVVTVTDGVATVAYDFGIAALTICEMDGTQYVVLVAKVQGAEGVDYAKGTEIVVEQNGASIEAEGMETDPDGVAPAVGVKWFRISYDPATTAPLRFKVKATKTATP